MKYLIFITLFLVFGCSSNNPVNTIVEYNPTYVKVILTYYGSGNIISVTDLTKGYIIWTMLGSNASNVHDTINVIQNDSLKTVKNNTNGFYSYYYLKAIKDTVWTIH